MGGSQIAEVSIGPLNSVDPEGGDSGNRTLDVSTTAPHTIAGGDCSPAHELAYNVPSRGHFSTHDDPIRRGGLEENGATENATHSMLQCSRRQSPTHDRQNADGSNSTAHNPGSTTHRTEPADIHQCQRTFQEQHLAVHHPEAGSSSHDQASGCNDSYSEYHAVPRTKSVPNVPVDMRPMETVDFNKPPELPLRKQSNQSLPINIPQPSFKNFGNQVSYFDPTEEDTAFSSQPRYNTNKSSQTNSSPKSNSPKVQECVSSFHVPGKPVAPCSQMNKLTVTEAENNQSFYPSTITHLSFNEKQLAASAVKKAALNMSCVKMFLEKDKSNSGIIGRRDFLVIMDRVGVLNGMSSREIDAVFKGFSVNNETELDYNRFTAACRQAIEGDHRLSRIVQK